MAAALALVGAALAGFDVPILAAALIVVGLFSLAAPIAMSRFNGLIDRAEELLAPESLVGARWVYLDSTDEKVFGALTTNSLLLMPPETPNSASIIRLSEVQGLAFDAKWVRWSCRGSFYRTEARNTGSGDVWLDTLQSSGA